MAVKVPKVDAVTACNSAFTQCTLWRMMNCVHQTDSRFEAAALKSITGNFSGAHSSGAHCGLVAGVISVQFMTSRCAMCECFLLALFKFELFMLHSC